MSSIQPLPLCWEMVRNELSFKILLTEYFR